MTYGIVDERQRDRIAESLREEYIRKRRSTFPHFSLNRKTYDDEFWERNAQKLMDKLGKEFNVGSYINVMFEKYGSASVAPPMNMLGSDKLIALFKSGVFDESAKRNCIKHLLNMERLYESYRSFKPVAEILLDNTLYFNEMFRYVKALEEKCFHIADLYEQQCIAYLNENPVYREILGNRLPEKLRCS